MISVDRLRLLLLSCSVLILISACATVPEERDWIKIGQTTREDVIKRYGEPDFVIVAGDEETATYRPKRVSPRAEIPTIQAGPAGMSTTKMEPLNTGSRSPNGGLQKRPEQELQIRYNAGGIVQEVMRK